MHNVRSLKERIRALWEGELPSEPAGLRVQLKRPFRVEQVGVHCDADRKLENAFAVEHGRRSISAAHTWKAPGHRSQPLSDGRPGVDADALLRQASSVVTLDASDPDYERKRALAEGLVRRAAQ